MLGRPRLAPIVATLLLASVGFWITWRWVHRPLLSGASARPSLQSPKPLPELVEIKPGTLIGDEAPDGWSDLVIKSTMRLESGDLATLPSFGRNLATLFRTAVLADIETLPGTADDGKVQPQYILRRVGMGLALSDRDGDLVVSPERISELNIKLSLAEKLVLERAEAALRRGRLAAGSPSFAIYDAEAYLAEGGQHRQIFLRYALLVDPNSGELQTLVWPMNPEPDDREPPESITLLEPALLFDCGLDVQADRAFGRLPVGWDFAMVELPPGRPVPVPARLQAILVLDPEYPDEVQELERGLRRVLEQVEQSAIVAEPRETW